MQQEIFLKDLTANHHPYCSSDVAVLYRKGVVVNKAVALNPQPDWQVLPWRPDM